MAKGAKTRGKEPVVLTPAQKVEWDSYRRDWSLAIPELFRIIDADSAGTIISLIFRTEQQDFFNTVQRQRSVNIYRSLRRNYTDWEEQLLSVLRIYELPKQPSQLVELIFKSKPENVLITLQEDRKLEKVTDSPVLIIVGKPRQIGISTTIEAIELLFLLFHPNSKALVMSLDDDSAENVLDLLVTMIDNWPEEKVYCKPEFGRQSDDYIKINNNGSEAIVKTAEGAQARSFKQDFFHITEFAHYKNAEKIGAALAAVRSHAWIFIESTANGPTGAFYKRYQSASFISDTYQKLDAGKPVPDRGFIKWFAPWIDHVPYTAYVEELEEQDLLASMDAYEHMLFTKFPMKMTLGKIKWRREKIANDCADQKALTPAQFFMQEYPIDEDEMFQQKASAVFALEELNKLSIEAKASAPSMFKWKNEHSIPELALYEGEANFFIWEAPDPKKFYLITADLSQGRGLDSSIIDVYDRCDGTRLVQVAQFFSNSLKQTSMGHIAVAIQELYNDGFLAWESNNSGEFGAVVTNICRKYNIYYRTAHDNIMKTPTRIPGINTTHSMKVTMVEMAKGFMADNRLVVKSVRTLHELKLFAFDDSDNPNSAMNAPEGEHDDRVITLIIGVFISQPNSGAPLIDHVVVEKQKEIAKSREEELLSEVDKREEQLAREIAKIEKQLEQHGIEHIRRAAHNPFEQRRLNQWSRSL